MKTKDKIIFLIFLTCSLLQAQQNKYSFTSFIPDNSGIEIRFDKNLIKLSSTNSTIASSLIYSGHNELSKFENHNRYYNLFGNVYNTNALQLAKKKLLLDTKGAIKAASLGTFNLLNENGEENESDKSGSFFSDNLFYFLGATALAVTFYIIWTDKQEDTPTNTFGYPPKP